MLNTYIAGQIYAKISFGATLSQKKVVEKLSEYLSSSDYSRIFVLNGYAGTGKTTLISALVAVLRETGVKSVLLAPTGRAAKVLTRYSGQQAFTIHKRIYRQRTNADYESKYSLDMNKEQGAVFIVDEASMLSDSSGDGQIFGSGSLLEDLITYVRKGRDCRLILVGDNAQLPPVGADYSPALEPSALLHYGDVTYTSMDDVVRQSVESGILFNATMVRCMLENNLCEIPRFDLSRPDIEAIDGGEFLEKLQDCYDTYGRDETIVVTRSNKRANRFNEGVRRYILSAEEAIESGDMLMVVKNNYHYTERDPQARMPFIANGDLARVHRIYRTRERYGFRFAYVELEFPDYDDYSLECWVLLDVLHSDAPSLSREQQGRLFRAVEQEYAEISQKGKRYKAVLGDDFFCALQVKFAYAITCHKAQGGQWSAIFLDVALFGPEGMTLELLRWLYTAVTRATERLYLVNYDDRFFVENE